MSASRAGEMGGSTLTGDTPEFALALGETGLLSATASASSLSQVFPVGSISKTACAVLALKLAAAGRLRLDDGLGYWLPEDAARIQHAERITVRLLLDHRAGLFNYTDLPRFQGEMPWTLDEAVDAALARRPYFAPGQGWHYSNTHYLLVQKILEKAGGKPLGALFQEQVAQPLRLVHTGYPAPSARPVLPTGWHESKPVSAVAAGLADAGLVSTAPELLRFVHALFEDDGFLSPAQRREMTHFVGIAPERGVYGLGLARGELRGVRYWYHSGFLRGFLSGYYWFPDQGQAMVVLLNRSDAQGEARQKQLFEAGACQLVRRTCS